jgi:phosphopantothenoylcysteine decarboxylase/phosphopantothenate--cysteine ligase
MRTAVNKYFTKSSIIVKAAAVSDYRPQNTSKQKIKKTDTVQHMVLERTVDILAELGKKKGQRILVGFAAETQQVSSNASEKLKKKNLDMIVANDVSRQGIGFGSGINQVQLIFRDGRSEQLPTLPKEELAHIILDRISSLKKSRGLK